MATQPEYPCGDEYGHCIEFQMGNHFAPEEGVSDNGNQMG